MGEPRHTLLVATTLGPRSAAWDALASLAPIPSPFLRAWWLDAVAGERAHHVLVECGGELVGGLPLVRDRVLGVPRYRFAGQGVLCPDHLDLVSMPGHEEAVGAAVRAWFTAPGTRLLDLVGLAADSRLAAALCLSPDRVDSAPYHPLPPPGEDYLSTRSSNFRRATRKADRRLVDDHVVHRRSTAGSLTDDLEEFRRLSGDREGRGPLLAEMPRLSRAVGAGLERHEARVDVLETPEEVVAVSIAFEAAGRLSMYQVARSLDRRYASAGTVLLARLIDEAVAAGLTEVDMLRGAEAYKSSFADEVRAVYRLRAGHGARASALARIGKALVLARPHVRALWSRVVRSG